MNIEKTYRLANEYYINRKYEKAKNLFLQVLKTYPRHPQANNNLGLTYKKLNEQKKALKCFKTAVDFDENYIIGLNNLAKTLQELNYLKESLKYFEKSLNIDLEKKETNESYAHTLFRLNQHNKALKFLKKGIGSIRFTKKEMLII